METVPKDGTEFLLAWSADRDGNRVAYVSVVFWGDGSFLVAAVNACECCGEKGWDTYDLNPGCGCGISLDGWMAMPPIILQQFRMFYAKDRPIGVILWAFVNDEVEQRLLPGNARMRPQDWKCGDKPWIVEVVAPFGGTDEMLKDLKGKVFKDREVRFRAVEGGKGVVRVM
jgi:hypothetical protein